MADQIPLKAITDPITGAVTELAEFQSGDTISKALVGLSNVTNDAQAKASIYPNTVPAAGRILVGQVTGKYESHAMAGDATMSESGLLTIGNNKVTNAKLAGAAAKSIKGNRYAVGATPQDLTPAEARTVLELGTAATADTGTGPSNVILGNDSRLSDAREWAAETVSQTEAEAGTATTRRAWTAQRVRQVIAAWWNITDAPQDSKQYARKNGAWIEVVSSSSGGGAVGTLSKADRSTPCLVKTGAGTLAVKAGTTVYLSSGAVSFAAQTAITMPTLTAGEDYSVWVLPNGTAQAVADPFFAPASAPAAGALKIGGFHYGLVAPGTTVASGGFATAGTGMIWTQADVDLIAGIDAWSIWDLNYRPACPNQRGMARTVGGAWLDIYFCNTDVDVNGSSRYNTNVASGTVLPKKPQAFGGNGAATYPDMTWWVASELAHAVGKRLPWEHEFVDAAFGVTEATAIGGAAATIPATGRAAGFTSRIGIEQATGHIWTWGMDSGQAGETYSWQAITGGRGSTYTTPHRRVLLGGARSHGSGAGSRCSDWFYAPSNSSWHIGLRAACDHYQGGY